MRVIIEDEPHGPHGPEPMPPAPPMPIVVCRKQAPIDNGKMGHMMEVLEQIRQRHNDDVFFAGELQSNIGGDDVEERKPEYTAF